MAVVVGSQFTRRARDLRRLAAVYDAMPAGVMALVRVVEFGARHGGTLGPSPDRGNPLAHLRAAHRHVLHTVSAVDYATPEAAVWPIDAGKGGTGELHLANAAGRLVIACELVGRGK
ncbi:MAG: hypothetical protein KA201_39415 [Kofleriaceae bacterium]|nr:hypothetical protein [Kofleriaceae bacterium]